MVCASMLRALPVCVFRSVLLKAWASEPQYPKLAVPLVRVLEPLTLVFVLHGLALPSRLQLSQFGHPAVPEGPSSRLSATLCPLPDRASKHSFFKS